MDPANVEASYAFMDAKRKLRMVLSTADLQHVPWATDAAVRMVRDSSVLMLATFPSFIHSIGVCRMRQFLVVIRSFFHFSLFCTLSFHPFPPTSLPSSLTSSCHLFLGLPLSLVVSKFIYNTFLGILFSSMPKPTYSI